MVLSPIRGETYISISKTTCLPPPPLLELDIKTTKKRKRTVAIVDRYLVYPNDVNSDQNIFVIFHFSFPKKKKKRKEDEIVMKDRYHQP